MPERDQDRRREQQKARKRQMFREFSYELEEILPLNEEDEEEREVFEDEPPEEEVEETSRTILDVKEEPPWNQPHIGREVKIAVRVLKTLSGYFAVPSLMRPTDRVVSTLKSVCDALNEVLNGFFPFEDIQKPEELGVIAQNINRRFSMELGVELPDGTVYPFSAFIPKGRPKRLYILRNNVRRLIGENKEEFMNKCENESFDKVLRWTLNRVQVENIEDLKGLLHPIWRGLRDGKKKERTR